ncbi:hypothetical protein [Rhizobium esperanzae]|uniref:Uncharacterized protein n=1 Tax=Rhizobium esperanzae TaxID=1967781 RepID=A0A7W6R4D4_9HYPH|nr:hypothetical protein [Rhizobium esperanzae]MBB4236228.1 hypothetical protein [Rhizobium esperanzae]
MSVEQNIDLSPDEQKIIEESVASIRKVLRSKNKDIKSLIGMVTSEDVGKTAKAVEVRFAEENVLNVQMNMVAFD